MNRLTNRLMAPGDVMVRRSSGVLAFEDSTFGSFAAIAHVPSAGFRWAVPKSPPDAFPINDSKKSVPDGAVLNGGDRANEMSDEEQSVELMLGLHVPLPQGGPWLVANEPLGADPWGYRYAPLEKWDFGQLVAKFAGLRTEKHYLEFANDYGKLRHPQQLESAKLWEVHTRRVRALITIWSWVNNKDREKLSWVVRWTEGVD